MTVPTLAQLAAVVASAQTAGTAASNNLIVAQSNLASAQTMIAAMGVVVPPVVPPSSFPDGSATPAPGLAQYPALLSAYAARPPWKVAGVDYRVGTRFTPTKNPITSPPVGCTVSGSQIRVNADNVVINGYDMTVNGGMSIYNPSNNNLTVTDNKFGGPNYANLPTGIIDPRGVGATIEYNEVDGSSIGGINSLATLVFYDGSGTLSLRYNWFKNFPQQIIEILNGLSKLTYQFNLIDNFVKATNAHENWLQFSNGVIATMLVSYNTVRQPLAGGAEGFQAYMNGVGTLVSPVISNNTVAIVPPGTMTSVLHGSGGTSTTISGRGTCSDNYVALGGDDGFGGHPNFCYPGSFLSGWDGTGNIDMSTGAAIPFPA